MKKKKNKLLQRRNDVPIIIYTHDRENESFPIIYNIEKKNKHGSSLVRVFAITCFVPAADALSQTYDYCTRFFIIFYSRVIVDDKPVNDLTTDQS